MTSTEEDRHTRPLATTLAPELLHGGDQVVQMISPVPVVVVVTSSGIAGRPFSEQRQDLAKVAICPYLDEVRVRRSLRASGPGRRRHRRIRAARTGSRHWDISAPSFDFEATISAGWSPSDRHARQRRNLCDRALRRGRPGSRTQNGVDAQVGAMRSSGAPAAAGRQVRCCRSPLSLPQDPVRPARRRAVVAPWPRGARRRRRDRRSAALQQSFPEM